ncbi:ParB/RepB/Spo0J family partition protein [Rubinisphaera margarita]|uniref:ParB/RepB/Spo0J family partition protein n=1 Tax=Rubinisphaera margarita TaxID=2909586 RepID=UPI001EE85572|nr:hypothetical protein [Rubinisphaera margarita]MCG6157102.1 hypothetical protein [Rubinisphaera margarita]
MEAFKLHPVAELFPEMTEQQFEILKADIRANGCKESVVLYRGEVIDGRHRLRACRELKIEPQLADLDEDFDPWEFAISKNLCRRHLTTSQRAVIAAELAKLKRGDNQHAQHRQNCRTTSEAAKALNVSERTVRAAKQVADKGSPELQHAVKTGEMSVHRAASIARTTPPADQATAAKQGTDQTDQAFDEDAATDRLYDRLRSELHRWPVDRRHVAAEHVQLILDEYPPAQGGRS